MLQKVIGEPEFRVRCLGGLSLVEVRSGTDMTPAKRKPRALLAYLCIERKPVGRERLAALLWGDRGDEQARASLRQTLYELRSPLGGDRLLRAEGETVAIGEYVSTDIEAITAAAQSGDLGGLQTALSEWRGEILEDLSSIDPTFDAWLESARLRIQEALFRTALDAARAGMAKGEVEASRQIVNLLQDRDSTNEMVLRLGLTLDHLAGDSAALHRRYERFRKLLKSELDATPSTETQRLFHHLDAQAAAPVAKAAYGINGEDRRDIADNLPASTAHLKEQAATDPPAQKLSAPASRWVRTMFAALAASTVLVMTVLSWTVWNSLHKTAPSRAEPLLAVMPFQNLSGDAGSRYFSDGITEEIVDALLRITQIRVASTGSSFRLRDAGASEAAKALSATHILEGSVRHEGDRIRVVAQLIDGRNNRVVWSRTYDRTMVEITAVQDDVAVQIANALDMRISPTSLHESQHIDPSAYDHYLKGRDLDAQENFETATAEFEESVRLAPDFAEGWSALAYERWGSANIALIEHPEKYRHAMLASALAASQRALALDPNNGEALVALALLTPAWQLSAIDRLLTRGMRLEPNNRHLLNMHAEFLAMTGRMSDAPNALTRAFELDRASLAVAADLSDLLLKAGRSEEAEKILNLRKEDSSLFVLRAEDLLFRRDWAGLATVLKVVPDDLTPAEREYFRLCRETALVLAARSTDQYESLRARWRARLMGDTDVVQTVALFAVQFLVAMGDVDGALRGIQSDPRSPQSDYSVLYMPWDAVFAPNLEPLHSNPGFPALLARWGLWDYWRTSDRWPDFCDEPTLPFDCKAEAQKFAHSTRAYAAPRHA